jgi:hypothetical protein
MKQLVREIRKPRGWGGTSMLQIRLGVAAVLAMLTACGPSEESPESAPESQAKLVKYTYTGPKMTVFTGAVPPWTTESRMSGYFITAEIPPMTTVDYLDPDIHWPFPNLPAEFAFSDGARTIKRGDLVDVMKDTGLRIDPTTHEVRTFNFTTDSDGNIMAWDILFVHDVRGNTYLSAHNGGIYGQDLTEVDATTFGCVASVKCTANANYTSQGPVLPDTQFPGTWTKEVLDAAGGEG